MPKTSKPLSRLDGNQTLQGSFNDVTSTLSVDGFLALKVGHRIDRSLNTTNLLNDTEVYEYFDGAVKLLEISIVYTDDSLETILSVERTA